jgi:hypothetical protein
MRDSPTLTPLCISVPTLTPISMADAGGRATSKALAKKGAEAGGSVAGAEEVEGYAYGDYHRRW